MFDTKTLCLDLVHRAAVATSLSTSGHSDARYLAVNKAYLALAERVWDELKGECLIAKGSAISTPERDRRLALLERQGYYDRERAVIGVGSGRRIEVEISAQRIWCSGLACDLEYFRQVVPGAADISGPAAISLATPRTSFLPEVAENLAHLSPLDRAILLRRMLTAVAEGAVMVGQVRPNRAVWQYSEALRERLAPYICVVNSTDRKTHFDFSRLADASVQTCLLELADELWSLIHFIRDPVIVDMLRSLVVPYTTPAPLLVGGR